MPRGQVTSSGKNSSGKNSSEGHGGSDASIGEAPTPASGLDSEPSSGHADTVADDSGGANAGGSGRDRGVSAPRQQVAQVGMTLGRYELVSELGEGGMATVFGARDTTLGREVALKVMFPHLARRKEAASRFKREARAAACLDHKHILQVYDVGGGEVEGGLLIPPYIVLERIDGASLDDFFREHSPPISEVVAAIGVAMCRGLAQAHARKIVHRDIKPANVMVTKAGRLVIADFGVARVGDGDDDSVVTRTGTILGTPAYMSPEQASADTVDARSDLYSLGATLYRIATGVMPYTGSAAQIMSAIIAGTRVPAQRRDPRIGRELSRVIDKLMETNPSERYGSAKEAEEALLEVVHGGGEPDVEALLANYVRDPNGQNARTRDQAITQNLVRARQMSLSGRTPLALAIAERVLAISPNNAQAQVLCDSLGVARHKHVKLAIFGPMIVTAAVGVLFWGHNPAPSVEYVVDDDAEVNNVPRGDAAQSEDASAQSPPLDMPTDVPTDVPSDAGPTSMMNAVDGPKPWSRRPRRVRRTLYGRGGGQVNLGADAAVPASALGLAKAGDIETARLQPASLTVDIRPWCDVWIDGKKRGRASAKDAYSLKAGSHLVECKQGGTGMHWEKLVVLGAGESRTLKGSVLGMVLVEVRLAGGGEVRIGERRIADGKSLRIAAGRYRIQVWRQGRPFGLVAYLGLRANCTLRDQPKLACTNR